MLKPPSAPPSKKASPSSTSPKSHSPSHPVGHPARRVALFPSLHRTVQSSATTSNKGAGRANPSSLALVHRRASPTGNETPQPVVHILWIAPRVVCVKIHNKTVLFLSKTCNLGVEISVQADRFLKFGLWGCE